MTQFVVVIPARFASERLPGKPLRDIAGKPMLQHVYERGMESGASDVVIATDDERIADAAILFSAKYCMTSSAHKSGTDRLAEVAREYSWSDDTVILNLQGDEPLMPPELINQCAALLDDLVTLPCCFPGEIEVGQHDSQLFGHAHGWQLPGGPNVVRHGLGVRYLQICLFSQLLDKLPGLRKPWNTDCHFAQQGFADRTGQSIRLLPAKC